MIYVVKSTLFVCFLVHLVVREEKYLKLLAYGGGSLRDVRTHNVYAAAMAFSDDGSLFAYCDGSR